MSCYVNFQSETDFECVDFSCWWLKEAKRKDGMIVAKLLVYIYRTISIAAVVGLCLNKLHVQLTITLNILSIYHIMYWEWEHKRFGMFFLHRAPAHLKFTHVKISIRRSFHFHPIPVKFWLKTTNSICKNW